MDKENTCSSKAPFREHIGVLFKCCRVYSRVYLNAKKTAFVGWCPKCAKKVELKVSPTGTDSHFFEVF